MLTWELVGAVVGAGLASGREIASFFTRYGRWSYPLIVIAVAVMVFLADAQLPINPRYRWFKKLWEVLLKLLLVATGGAMLSGAGEIAALTIPIRRVRWVGMAATLLLAWALAHRVRRGLACVSRCLLIVLGVLIGLGLTLPRMQAVRIPTVLPGGVVGGIAYGGFNAALQTPIFLQSGENDVQVRRKASWRAGVILLGLLILGNGVLLRHPALQGEEMPFIRMMAHYGKAGYWIGALGLYLAILSTLTACVKGSSRNPLMTIGMMCTALLGFGGVVETLYPLLGICCCVMLVSAKFMNSVMPPFISRMDMI